MGVCFHSKSDVYDTLYIVSVDSNPIVVNQFNNFLIDHDMPHKVLAGTYEGISEFSWLMNEKDYEWAKHKTWFDDQDSVLKLGPVGVNGCKLRHASLVFTDDRPDMPLGWFVSTGHQRPVTGDFTYDILAGIYYHCVPVSTEGAPELSAFTDDEKVQHLAAYKAGRVKSATLM